MLDEEVGHHPLHVRFLLNISNAMAILRVNH